MMTCRLLAGLLVTLLSLPAWARDDFERPAANVALGAPYTLSPAPGYPHCTDPDDGVQLTDGIYTQGYFWVQEGTVGWTNRDTIVVTLDLGADRPLRGASFHTAAGTAGVNWPLAIYLLAAGEDRVFHEVGELVGLSAKRGLPEPEGYATYRYWTDELRTHGRYLAFVFAAQPYAFVDEIEVYQGEADWLALPLPGEPILDIEAHMRTLAWREAVQRRLRQDVQALRAKAGGAEVPDGVRRQLVAELAAVEQGMLRLPGQAPPGFRATLPLNALHADLFRAHARLWRARTDEPLVAWSSPLWERLGYLDDPTLDGAAGVAVAMMLNEYRAGALNLSNTTDGPLQVRLRLTGLPGGVSPPYVTVHEVAWTDTREGVPVAAALPEAGRDGDAYLIGVPSGLTRQVWLTFHPVGVEPGDHLGAVELRGDGVRLDVPLRLMLYPLRFPDRPTLHFGGWDYTNGGGAYGVSAENRDALIEHLRERFVDSPWATNAVIPRGAHADDGTMTAPPATAAFDEWVARWPDARQYLIFASVGSHYDRWPTGAPGFETAVGEWVTFWAEHARGRGIDPHRIGLLLVDEPHGPEQDGRIIPWARAVRAAGTGIRVWEDPLHDDMAQADPEMIALCDVLCPNRPRFLERPQSYRDFFAARRQAGTTLEFYSCSGPARLLDPYAYHRLQAWDCWRYGAAASYFWAFGDNGEGSSWNEYASQRTAFTPLFLDEESVTAGKHMEACREGIEDYEYLVMLRAAVEEAERQGRGGEALERARRLLAGAAERVCEAGASPRLTWDVDLDRTLADRVRVEMLEVLAALR